MKILKLITLILFPISNAMASGACGVYSFRGTIDQDSEKKVYLVENKDSMSEKRYLAETPIARGLALISGDYVSGKVKIKHIKDQDEQITVYAIMDLKQELENPFKSADEMKLTEKIECL